MRDGLKTAYTTRIVRFVCAVRVCDSETPTRQHVKIEASVRLVFGIVPLATSGKIVCNGQLAAFARLAAPLRRLDNICKRITKIYPLRNAFQWICQLNEAIRLRRSVAVLQSKLLCSAAPQGFL